MYICSVTLVSLMYILRDTLWYISPLLLATTTKGNPAYQARIQIHYNSKLLLNCHLKGGHPSYNTTFSLQKGWPFELFNYRITKVKLSNWFIFLNNKCGHRNVPFKRQVWMSIFHIINFKKKKIHGHRGPGFFLIKT